MELVGINPGISGVGVVTAIMFGVLFSMAIRRARRKNQLGSYTTIYIMGGVIGTVVIGVLFGWVDMTTALRLGILFVLTGAPQIFEEMEANTEQHEKEKQRIRDMYDNTP